MRRKSFKGTDKGSNMPMLQVWKKTIIKYGAILLTNELFHLGSKVLCFPFPTSNVRFLAKLILREKSEFGKVRDEKLRYK